MELVMRVPRYLSPSSLSKFEDDRRLFYDQYLNPVRPDKPPQEDFMAVGSCIDAILKSELHIAVFGEEANKGSQFEFQTIFETQVGEHARDFVRPIAQDLWKQYVDSGAYKTLRRDVMKSPTEPRMEYTVEDVIGDVPLLGKPDLMYSSPGGIQIYTDFKVNGSRSKTGASPMQGYKVCRDCYGSRTHNKPFQAQRRKTDPPDKVYKDYTPMTMGDVEINTYYLEEFCDYWADQLGIYAWLEGEEVGSEDFIIRMEQFACRPVKKRKWPRVKCATHMSRISGDYQIALLARIKMCWATIMSGHIFDDVSRERSDEICEQLKKKSQRPVGIFPVLDKYRNTVARFK